MHQYAASGMPMMTETKASDTTPMPSMENVLSAVPDANEKDRNARTVVIDVSAEAGPTRLIASSRFSSRSPPCAFAVCQRKNSTIPSAKASTSASVGKTVVR